MKAIGIDIGTTTISAVLLDTGKQQVITSKTIANDSFIKTEQEWERIQDVSVIIPKAKAVLDEFLDAYEGITAIGLTCQMHGILYLNQEGQCISPLYTWQDGSGNQLFLPEERNKTKDAADTEKQESFAAWALRITGRNCASGYGLVTHLYHVKKNLVPEHAVKICAIGDYLGMILTGRTKPLSHTTNAASFGFFDVKNGCFDETALEAVGLKADILPEVTGDFAVLGTYRGLPVTAAIGDNQASFLGSVGVQKSVLLVNMGTGGQISVLSDEFFEAPGIEARPFTAGTYLLAGASLCGGRAYAILEKFFRMYAAAAGMETSSQYAVMEKLASAEAVRLGMEAGDSDLREVLQTDNDTAKDLQTDKMQVTTTFNGTRVDPSLRGSIMNISEDNFTPEGLVYGVLDGMAQELYDMFLLIQKGIGVKAEKIVASGNGLRKNAVLRDIFSRKFRADLTMARYEEEAACGAAISSAIAAGEV